MSDTPPPELVAIARSLHLARFDDWDSCECSDDEMLDQDTLAALAEWADGGLIDPSTWTVVEAERETGWCVFMGHGPDCECDAGDRWVLSPREGER